MTEDVNATADEAITAFPIQVSDGALQDLRQRLQLTRLPNGETVSDGSQGPTLYAIGTLVERWQDGYDWRATERLINGWGSSHTVIDGMGVHFLHIRSDREDALPLLLAHGWPGSILEFRDVIGPLTDPSAHGGTPAQAFHLVIPSMPGFGFSDQPTEPGWDVSRVAGAWAELMKRLGYGDRWVAQGGDWGSAVVTALAQMGAPGLQAIHLNMVMFQPTEEEVADATPEEQAMLDDAQRYQAEFSGYMTVQNTRPQSVAFGLADSPAGLAAWIYALFQDVTDSAGKPVDVIPLDHILDDIMLYWLPNAGPSSARFYWENAKAGPSPAQKLTLPTGISMFPKEAVRLSRRWAERRVEDLRYFNEPAHGGHFAAMENPRAFVTDVRATFESLR